MINILQVMSSIIATKYKNILTNEFYLINRHRQKNCLYLVLHRLHLLFAVINKQSVETITQYLVNECVSFIKVSLGSSNETAMK